MHSRVVHVHGGVRFDIYGGRGRCPCGTTGCTHMALGSLGNQWGVRTYGKRAIVLYLDWVEKQFATTPPTLFVRQVEQLAGKVLGCWCVGKYPACHCEVLAGLADGVAFPVIRADILARLGLSTKPAQAELFKPGCAP